jgi:hypothetical protein
MQASMSDTDTDLAFAQQVVVEYARTLEQDLNENRFPARVDSLPFAKAAIQDAIETSIRHLSSKSALTDDLREFFEIAYVSLAEYLEPELVTLVLEYRRAAEDLSAGTTVADRTSTASWRTLAEGAGLAANVARATTMEAHELRARFQQLISQS